MKVTKKKFVIYEYNWICPHCAAACEGYSGGNNIDVLKCDSCGTEIKHSKGLDEWEIKGNSSRK
jgi:rubredoxin